MKYRSSTGTMKQHYQSSQWIYYGSPTPKEFQTQLAVIVGYGGGNYIAQGMTVGMPVLLISNLRRPWKKKQQEKALQCVLLLHSAYVPKSQNTFYKISNQPPCNPNSNMTVFCIRDNAVVWILIVRHWWDSRCCFTLACRLQQVNYQTFLLCLQNGEVHEIHVDLF